MQISLPEQGNFPYQIKTDGMFILDALEIVKEDITITAGQEAHFLIIEMAFDEECYKEKYNGIEVQYKGE